MAFLGLFLFLLGSHGFLLVDLYSEVVAEIVREFKLFAGDLLFSLLTFVVLTEVSKEEEALGELDMLVESMGETVADLFQV